LVERKGTILKTEQQILHEYMARLFLMAIPLLTKAWAVFNSLFDLICTKDPALS